MGQFTQVLDKQRNVEPVVPVINDRGVINLPIISGFVYKEVQSLFQCGHCFSKPLLE